MTIAEAIQLLELTPPFTAVDVKKAYREAILVWHPDRFPTNPGLREKANTRSCRINEAFEVLSRALAAGHDFTKVSPRPVAGRRKVARQEPPHTAAEFNARGLIYWAQGKPNKAIADFSKAIQLDPTVAIYYRNRGIVFASRRRRSCFRTDFRKHGAMCEFAGQYDDAIADHTEVIQSFQGGHSDSWHELIGDYLNRARVYRLMRDWNHEIADYTEIIARVGDCQAKAAYLKRRAQAYYDNSDFASAIEDLTEAVCRDPRGVFYLVQGECRCGGHDPGEEGWKHKDAVEVLAALYANAGDFNRAVHYQTLYLKLADVRGEQATDGVRRLEFYRARNPGNPDGYQATSSRSPA